jgi:FkbM family methyltransferase
LKGFRVIAIEADPRLISLAERRFTPYIDSGQLTLVQAVISHDEGSSVFHICNSKPQFSSISEDSAARDPEGYKTVHIAAKTLSSIIAQHGTPYYVKIDIDRAHHIALQSLIDNQIKPHLISAEGLWSFRLAQQLGYKKYQMIYQKRIPDQIEPFPSTEGTFVGTVFSRGSSGLFGNDLPDEWLSSDAAQELFQDIVKKQKTMEIDTWVDWHCAD